MTNAEATHSANVEAYATMTALFQRSPFFYPLVKALGAAHVPAAVRAEVERRRREAVKSAVQGVYLEAKRIGLDYADRREEMYGRTNHSRWVQTDSGVLFEVDGFAFVMGAETLMMEGGPKFNAMRDRIEAAQANEGRAVAAAERLANCQ